MTALSPRLRRKRRAPNRCGLPVTRQQYRILCVDDDDDLTRIIKARLRKYKVEVTRAAGGKEGLKHVHSHRPSAIITDLGMPNGDGEFLLRRLKSRASTASIPVVVVSGVHDERRIARVQSMGAAAILHKPLKFDALFAELASHLDWTSADSATSTSDSSEDNFTFRFKDKVFRTNAAEPPNHPPHFDVR